jgi:hypothetical protein
LLDIISGKTTGVEVAATKIGPEYNLSKDSTFSVGDFSRTIAIAIAEKNSSVVVLREPSMLLVKKIKKIVESCDGEK